MKKRGILLLIVVMIGSTSNVYGETFNIQSQGIANYAQTECQFRYCGTAIPFLTVRSTAR